MKKKRTIYILCIGITIVALAGCGGEAVDQAGDGREPVIVTPKPALSAAETHIMEYEWKYAEGDFTAEDYMALGSLYNETGRVREQRDMLEQSYRLYGDGQAFEVLQGLSVNLAEEEDVILTQARTMLQNLELPEYLAEGIHTVSSPEWMDIMMPRLYQGQRSYFLQEGDRTALIIEAGYDENGMSFSNVWYLGADGHTVVLQQRGAVTQLLMTQMAEGEYHGAFESWVLNGNTGDILQEQGTLTHGRYTGDYTARIHTGTESGAVFDLWNMREGMAYTVYTGHFDEQGNTTLEQPGKSAAASLAADSEFDGCVVYAYDEDGENCLFVGVPEGTGSDGYAFGTESFGVQGRPVVTVYEPQQPRQVQEDVSGNLLAGVGTGTEAANPGGAISVTGVRIYDGELQLYDGQRWIGVGSAQQYVQADPFYAYTERKQTLSSAAVEDGGMGNRGSGSVPRPGGGASGAAAPSQTPKPPVTSQTPQTPTPPVSPAPDADDGPGDAPEPDSAPEPDPTPEPGPAPEPEPGPEPDSGDTDVGWTPDFD